ncbi:MAG: DUF6429 family protein [Rubrivivax sp.]|nr:DUF6429 family protein [Rubrivivax sp.]
MALNNDRIDDAVLALLLLGLHEGDRAWKSFDWEALGRLHAKGLTSDPVGRSKSVAFTAEGKAKAESLLQSLFGRATEPR